MVDHAPHGERQRQRHRRRHRQEEQRGRHHAPIGKHEREQVPERRQLRPADRRLARFRLSHFRVLLSWTEMPARGLVLQLCLMYRLADRF